MEAAGWFEMLVLLYQAGTSTNTVNFVFTVEKTSRSQSPLTDYVHFQKVSDSKVRELATVCLLWQQWTEASLRFDDVCMSVLHSCFIDLRIKLEGKNPNFCQQFKDHASLQCTCSHGTVCEGVLDSKQITMLEHPLYSPDLAPSDIFLFPKEKETLK
jgi:hypothetical protein